MDAGGEWKGHLRCLQPGRGIHLVATAIFCLCFVLFQTAAFGKGQNPEDEFKNILLSEIVAETCLAKITPVDNPEGSQFGKKLAERYAFLGPTTLMAVTGYAVSQQSSIERDINKDICAAVLPQVIDSYTDLGLSGNALKQALQILGNDDEEVAAPGSDEEKIREVLLTALLSDACVQNLAGLTNPESDGYTQKMLTIMEAVDSEAFAKAVVDIWENAEELGAGVDAATCKTYLPKGIADYREAGFTADALKKALEKIQDGAQASANAGAMRSFTGEALLKSEAGMLFWYITDPDGNDIVFIGTPGDVETQNKNLAECLDDASGSDAIVEIKGKWIKDGADGLEGLDIPSILCRRIK